MLGTINLYGQPGPVAIEINNKGWNHLLTTIAELVGIKKGIPQFSLFRRHLLTHRRCTGFQCPVYRCFFHGILLIKQPSAASQQMPPSAAFGASSPGGGAKITLLPPSGEVPRSGDGGALAALPMFRYPPRFAVNTPPQPSAAPPQRGWGCIPAALPMTSSRQKACDSIGPLHIETRPVYFFSYSFMSTYPLALRFPVSSFSRYTPWSSGAKPGRMFAVSTKSRK